MKTDKRTFVFYLDWTDILNGQPDNIRLAVFDAIIEYVKNGNEPEKGTPVYLAFQFIKYQIDKDTEKYADVCDKRANAGRKHKGNQYTKRNKTEQMEQVFQNGTNGTDNDYEYEYDNDYDNNTTINSSDISVSAEKSAQQPKAATKRKTAIDIEPLIAELPTAVQDIARMWVDYKKQQFGFSYKNEKSFEIWLKDLYKKSNGDIDTMQAVVEQSIANGYRGIFELKKQYQNANNEINFGRICQLSDAMLELERQQRSGSE